MFGQATPQIPAFPGAEGAGREATGGRGGAVYEVTNLHDDGPGSLRAAVEAKGPRTIVFRVSGTIPLESNLRIREGDLTIAGQTAPGDGICLANYTLNVAADNVIIRFLRVRVGDRGGPEGASGRDALSVGGTDRVIIDHCTFSWSIDEAASAYFNTRFTLQWCIVSESLRESLHPKDAHGYGGIWGGQGTTFHHNLLAHHSSRNPRLNGSRGMPRTIDGTDFQREETDLRNNVIYNWTINSAYAGEPRSDGLPSRYNIVGNYYKAGPATPERTAARIFNPTPVDGYYSEFYVAGNITTASEQTTADNWRGMHVSKGETIPESARRAEPVPLPPIAAQSAEEAYAQVLAEAGAVFPTRDAVDARVVQEVRDGTYHFGDHGLIDSQEQVGGWPELRSAEAPADRDHDGMPDAWEEAHGLDPADPADRNLDRDGDGYTALEDYLNGLVAHLPSAQAR